MLRPVGKSKFVVVSEKTGRRLSKPLSREKAQARLNQIELFKHLKSRGR